MGMKHLRFLLMALAFVCIDTAAVTAEERAYDSELAKRLGADERGMKSYVLCILKTGPKDADVKGDQRKEIFAGHFANIGRLADEGKLAVAGPFGKNDKSYRGLYIFNVATIEEAEKLVMLDPAVKAGVFVPELTPWYGSAAMMVVSETHKKLEQPKSNRLKRQLIEHHELLRRELEAKIGIRLEQPLRVHEIGKALGATPRRVASGAELLADEIDDADHS